MAIKRNRRFHAEVATSALSDIMFFLLLFFLIISTLANPNVIKVPLPESKANEKTNQQHVSLTITPEKKYFVDKDEVAFDQIESKLLAETKKLGDNTVVVRIPFDAQVQELVDVLRIGMENDLKMIIATKSDS
jgi:biopolymer transport protein ExbD